MDFEAKGLKITIDPSEQSSESLLTAAQEIADEARARGLELPFGSVAVASSVEKTNISEETYKSISEQRTESFKGYESTVDAINLTRSKRNKIQTAEIHMFDSEFEEWVTEDKLAYVNHAMEIDPGLSFTLVATPNVLVASNELKDIAKKFGKNQPYPTYVWDELYDKYASQQLSGAVSDDRLAFVFSLIPNKFTEDMYGTVEEQRAKLDKLQLDVNTAFLKVPSPLEAVAYWNTLRAQGDMLEGTDNFDKTYIRHFDLPEQRIVGRLYVPRSFVFDRGEPGLDYSDARDGSGARVAVG